MDLGERILKELSSPGRRGHKLPELDVPEVGMTRLMPKKHLRASPPPLPEVSEVDVVRHFTNISQFNYHIDRGFYPLGSCTMKYNPKVNEDTCRLPGFANLHPYQPEETVQGALQLMWELEEYLCEVSGMSQMSLQPAAGAHSELVGMLMIRGYHEKKGNPRAKVLIPDSAHGTNPASSAASGYSSVEIRSNEKGLVDVHALEANMDEDVAALMLTNPNTLGLFETETKEIAEVVHAKGGLVYLDGANLNALLGIFRPGDAGVDVVHFNLHKTFSTPHGGGGPGGGGVGVAEHLAPFLPVPVVVKKEGKFAFEYDRPDTIGNVHAFYGNFGVMVRAWTYLRMLGSEGIKRVAENAVINANYVMRALEGHYDLPYRRNCMHEFVLSGDRQVKHGVRTRDIAKRLLDYGVHSPTIYFPLIVHEALMIEPTETESRESLDRFIDAMVSIANEAKENPALVQNAPHTTPVKRLDEAKAARSLDVRWT
ncbi:MAG: aminomethyl-transferring glycine dehydrogenase subunit GcvPB [bacterium]